MDWLLFFQIMGWLVLGSTIFLAVMFGFAWLADKSEALAIFLMAVGLLVIVTYVFYGIAQGG